MSHFHLGNHSRIINEKISFTQEFGSILENRASVMVVQNITTRKANDLFRALTLLSGVTAFSISNIIEVGGKIFVFQKSLLNSNTPKEVLKLITKKDKWLCLNWESRVLQYSECTISKVIKVAKQSNISLICY